MPKNKCECITCYWAYRVCFGNHQKIGCKAQGRKYMPNWWATEKEWANQWEEKDETNI